MMSLSGQGGFTAVELLVTLFVAAIFLFSGYQLYTQVTLDGLNADATAKLSNITYAKAQETGAMLLENTGQAGCTDNFTSETAETIKGVGRVIFETSVSCPHGIENGSRLYRVKVKAIYDNNGTDKEVQHAIYTN